MRLNVFTSKAKTVAALCALAAPVAWAGYPDKPVRVVVTFAAGGASDILARVISEPLGKALGTTVIVDHKPAQAARSAGSTWHARRPTAIR